MQPSRTKLDEKKLNEFEIKTECNKNGTYKIRQTNSEIKNIMSF